MWFLLLFSLFFNISKQSCRHNESIEFFFHQCVYILVLNHFTIGIFFYLSRFRNWISPHNVFLGKIWHLFSTLKHYNLPIYAVKWPQIWSTSSTICTLQDCTVEIFIPYSHLDLLHFKSNDVFKSRKALGLEELKIILGKML